MAWPPARLSEVGIALGMVSSLVLTLHPRPGGRPDVFLVPFSDLAVLSNGSAGYFAVQVVGNLLVLAALGFFLPVRSARFCSVRRVVIVAAAISLTIEVTQYVAVEGRTFSVDDIMLNALGAGFAAYVSRPWWAEGRGLSDRRT